MFDQTLEVQFTFSKINLAKKHLFNCEVSYQLVFIPSKSLDYLIDVCLLI